MGSKRTTKVSSKSCNFGGFDFIIVDLPKGMYVLGVSSPPNAIPFKNNHKSMNLEALFEMASTYYTDDGPLQFMNKKIPLRG